MTPTQLAANAKAVDRFGFAPFQPQSVTCNTNDYVRAGGTVHKMNAGAALCGNSDGVGFVKRNTGITCVNCRRIMVKSLEKKGKAA